MSLSPLLGVVVGAALTVIVVVLLIILKVRQGHSPAQAIYEQKVIGVSHHNTVSSTKPLLRSSSPRDTSDERDPDVIPAKYGKISKPLIPQMFFVGTYVFLLRYKDGLGRGR